MPPRDRNPTVEDCDSDDSSAAPRIAVQSSQSTAGLPTQPSSRPQKPVTRSKSRPPAPPASDSGYSSHASAPTQTGTKSPAPARVNPAVGKAVQPPAVVSPTKSSKLKPQIHRNDSAHSTRAHTVSQDGRRCSDPNCVNPDCLSIEATNSERRYTLPERQRTVPTPQQRQQPYATPPTYPQQSFSRYPQQPTMQPPSMQPPLSNMMPPLATGLRPRSDSMSRTRPVSMYASTPYTGAQSGPPPSASAYYVQNQPVYSQQLPAYAGNMAPPPQMVDYPPPSPVVPPSPSSIPMNAYPGFSSTGLSARQGNPNVAGLGMPPPMPRPGSQLTRTMSARRSNERAAGRRSSAYIEDSESFESDSESSSASQSETDSEYDRRLQRRNSRPEPRTTQMVVIPTRRPSMSSKKYISDSAVPRARRDPRPLEITRTKTSQSDKFIDYPSSSDINDSDRTERAVTNRRDNRDARESYSDRSSRRPSVSSKGSSTRTKPSSLSSVTDYSRVIVEGPSGRRTAYLSKDEQAALIRRYQQQKLEYKLEEQRIRQDKIEAYQRATSGEPYDLTAENIKKHSDRKTKSRVSGRSERSSRSGSKMTNGEKCVKLESNGTVLHVYGDSKIEVRSGEDGQACFVIGSATGKESSYMASSKGSRVSHSRGRRETIREEYEPAL